MIQFEIINAPDQQWAAILNQRRVTLRLRYNGTTDRWSLDLSIDDLPVLHGRRIVSEIDLLAAYNFGIGVLFAYPITPGSVPDRASLPAGLVRLFHTTEAEIEEVLADATISP